MGFKESTRDSIEEVKKTARSLTMKRLKDDGFEFAEKKPKAKAPATKSSASEGASEAEQLRKELVAAQAKAEKAEQAQKAAEAKAEKAEKEAEARKTADAAVAKTEKASEPAKTKENTSTDNKASS